MGAHHRGPGTRGPVSSAADCAPCPVTPCPPPSTTACRSIRRRWTRVARGARADAHRSGATRFHPAWCALAGRTAPGGIPLVGFYHSNVPQIIGRRVGRRARRAADRPAMCAACTSASNLVFAPSRVMWRVPRGSRRAPHRAPAARRGIPRCSIRGGATPALRPRLGLPAQARVLIIRRPLRRRKESAGAAAGFRAPLERRTTCC